MAAIRRAAPRFRDRDLDLLLDAVEERRDILYPRGQRYPQRIVRRVWREVGVALSAVMRSMGHIPRTGEQCRAKLHDLTRAARGKTAHNFRVRARTGGGLRYLDPLTEYEQRALDLAVGAANQEVVTCLNGGPSEHRRGTDCSPREHEAPTSSSHSVELDRREGPRAGGPPSEASTPRSDAQTTDRDVRTNDSDSYESVTDGEGATSPDSDAQTTRHGGTEPRTSCGRNPGGHGSTQETELGTENDRAAAAMLSATPPNIADTLTSVGQVSGEGSGTHSGVHHTVELVPKVEVGDAEGLDGRRAGQAQHPVAAQTAPAFLAIPRPPTDPMQLAPQGPDDGMTAVFRQLQTQLEESIRVHKQRELPLMTATQADIARVASAMEAMGKTASAMGQVLQGVGLSAHASSVAHDRTAPSQAAMLQSHMDITAVLRALTRSQQAIAENIGGLVHVMDGVAQTQREVALSLTGMSHSLSSIAGNVQTLVDSTADLQDWQRQVSVVQRGMSPHAPPSLRENRGPIGSPREEEVPVPVPVATEREESVHSHSPRHVPGASGGQRAKEGVTTPSSMPAEQACPSRPCRPRKRAPSGSQVEGQDSQQSASTPAVPSARTPRHSNRARKAKKLDM
ncbi:uncharacterized protein LOC119953007 isoform X1 [Scyliorhinus canicula]|uniref:uncharacterized protein LOC119953007 isoform X1 n=1 Tax=Scyliorhinus canicula TaxID=7830 RepID=UPI0018F35D38|nr:uncharacterized protein LOC119953007 isoform X1 [Scyliorhinus canicula]